MYEHINKPLHIKQCELYKMCWNKKQRQLHSKHGLFSFVTNFYVFYRIHIYCTYVLVNHVYYIYTISVLVSMFWCVSASPFLKTELLCLYYALCFSWVSSAIICLCSLIVLESEEDISGLCLDFLYFFVMTM